MTDLTCYRCKQPLDGTKCGCRDGITLIHGDSREVLPALPEGCCSLVVTDPPYGIGFMGKDFDTFKPAYIESHKRSSSPEYAHKEHLKGEWGEDRPAWASARYDRSLEGNHAFQAWCHEMFSAILRVCRPGTMLASFGGTRTYHRLTCAIEDAGWEIRDCMMWMFGSGFPKSLDISKAIDKHGGQSVAWFGPWLRMWRRKRGISSNELARHFPSKTGGETGCVRNWELGLNMPTCQQFNTLCAVLNLPFGNIQEAEREVVGSYRAATQTNLCGTSFNASKANEKGQTIADITAPATDAAKTWEGYGTALSPSYEPIVLAMKPLDSTFAGNALEHGVAGINVDAGRVGDTSLFEAPNGEIINATPKGRWPKNAVFSHHPACVAAGSRNIKGDNREDCDGSRPGGFVDTGAEKGEGKPNAAVYSDETVEAYHCAAGCPCGHVWPTESLQPCPECGCRKTAWCCPVAMLGEQSGESTSTQAGKRGSSGFAQGYDGEYDVPFGDTGTAARFFKCFPPEVRFAYIPKASGKDRGNLPAEDLPLFGEGVPEFVNRHPTVKPLGIMLYLLGLLYPPDPDALCIDLFAGSGTTLVAAKQMGRRCLGIESEEEYCRIAVQRLEEGQ